MGIDHLIKAAEESNLKLLEQIEIVDLLDQIKKNQSITFEQAMIALRRET